MANLTRREAPWLAQDPFERLREWLDQDIGTSRFMPQTFSPQFEIKETKEAYVFRADLPGLEEKDLDVTLTGNRLTVSGKREAEQRKEDENYFTYERLFGQFTRSFTLPEGVDAEHVRAQMKNGVLELQLPKKPEHQAKKISIKGMVEKVKNKVEGKA
jgi:HSP20 family protein